jgi:hypothetical protein
MSSSGNRGEFNSRPAVMGAANRVRPAAERPRQ